jgi:hypothetical protein
MKFSVRYKLYIISIIILLINMALGYAAPTIITKINPSTSYGQVLLPVNGIITITCFQKVQEAVLSHFKLISPGII